MMWKMRECYLPIIWVIAANTLFVALADLVAIAHVGACAPFFGLGRVVSDNDRYHGLLGEFFEGVHHRQTATHAD